MASIAELVDFLMSLMRDDDTRRQFEQAPDATLTDRGLENVTGQDVRDARLMMADDGAIRPHARPPASSGSDDAVREISLTTTHFEVGDVTTTVISIDDRDTVVVDSFNNDVVAIQDNDTTDIDVISIVEGDEEQGEGEEEEAGAAPEGDLGEAAGGEPAGDPGAVLGPDGEFGGEPGSGPGAGSGLEGEIGGEAGTGAGGESVPDLETGSGAGEDFGGGSEVASGVSEGFTPEDSFTSEAAEDLYDELVG
jgi:hypothetical protein